MSTAETTLAFRPSERLINLSRQVRQSVFLASLLCMSGKSSGDNGAIIRSDVDNHVVNFREHRMARKCPHVQMVI